MAVWRGWEGKVGMGEVERRCRGVYRPLGILLEELWKGWLGDPWKGRGERGRGRVGNWDVLAAIGLYSLFIVVMCLPRKGASRQGSQLSFSLSKKGFDQTMGE